MKKIQKAVTALLCGGLMASVAACGDSAGGSAGADTSYTMWIYSGEDASYYTDYKENPVLQYVMGKKWGAEEKSVDIEFWTPPAGSESDNYSTMMTSGDYPDILDGAISDSPKNMYEDGIILDLTAYVEQYMPNYKAYLDAHPDVKANVTVDVDGEAKILSIRSAYDGYPYQFCGP